MNQPGPNIDVLVIIGIAIMLFLAISFLLIFSISQRKKMKYHAEVQQLRERQQNQLIEAAIKSEEGERHRIAEVLHDEIGAILSSVRLHFSNINTGQLDSRGEQLHEKSKLLLDETIQKVRTISHNLHSSLLKEFGLNEAIRNFLTKTVQGNLVSVDMHLDADYHILNPQTDIGIYRILQELINNILKHAHATHVNVSTELKNKNLELTVRHDGTGLSQQEFEELRYKPEGLGLKNIQNRIIMLKGNIYYEKDVLENSIKLTIPINAVS